MPPSPPFSIWIGWDPQDVRAHAVAEYSIRQHTRARVLFHQVSRSRLGPVYTRPTTTDAEGHLYDVISNAPMSTDHAIARFFIPLLCGRGWALFLDNDVLCRADIAALFELADEQYAVQVVKHEAMGETGAGVKKRGDVQLPYWRKNWSSVILFNCDHPAHAALTTRVLNTWPGRELHAFRWLDDRQIGPLPAGWNYLVGAQPRPKEVQLAHFTLGTPDMAGHDQGEFVDEWIAAATAAGHPLDRPRGVNDGRR